MGPEQIVLLLEFLLEEEKMSGGALQVLEKTYNLRMQDAEVTTRIILNEEMNEYINIYFFTPSYIFQLHDAYKVYQHGEKGPQRKPSVSLYIGAPGTE